MKLSQYNALDGVWKEGKVDFPRTIAKAMFPNVTFAVIQTLGQEMDAATLVGCVPEGFALDFATSAKKKGDFIMTSAPVMEKFAKRLLPTGVS
jgi:hypothetical protein